MRYIYNNNIFNIHSYLKCYKQFGYKIFSNLAFKVQSNDFYYVPAIKLFLKQQSQVGFSKLIVTLCFSHWQQIIIINKGTNWSNYLNKCLLNTNSSTSIIFYKKQYNVKYILPMKKIIIIMYCLLFKQKIKQTSLKLF